MGAQNMLMIMYKGALLKLIVITKKLIRHDKIKRV